MRAVIVDGNFPSFAQEITAAKAAGAELAIHQCKKPSEVTAAVTGAEIALVQFAPFGEDALAALAPGATVIRYGVGYDNIDVGAARRLGVKLGYIPDYCTDEVADHTAAMILAVLRCVPAGDRSIRANKWSVAEACPSLKPFSETVVGFLGLGRIGTQVMERLRAFGFRFIAFDPARLAGKDRVTGVTFVDLDTLFGSVDALSLHAPSNPGTRHIVNDATIGAMKPTSILVNTARGDLINTVDLAQALSEGRLRGAALDVFEQEPLPDDHPLRSAPNLVMTPHAAWYSERSIARLQQLAAEEITRALSGIAVRHPIPAS
jgi:D-3-phosphoglycerate dehydrogenase / 2-oxoglutarate reductase